MSPSSVNLFIFFYGALNTASLDVPHLEQFYILLFCPWNLALLWLQRCLMYLGMCSSVVVAFIDEGRRMSVINLGLRVVDLRCGGRQRHKGARLSEAELWGLPGAGGWCRGRRWAWLSALYRSWVLVACIACVMIVT
jgi:hypothetical protein